MLKNDKTISIRLPTKLYEDLSVISKEYNIPISSIIRTCLIDYVCKVGIL